MNEAGHVSPSPYRDKKNIFAHLAHHNMAFIGGFLGGYAILERSDFFGNAQTANLIHLVVALLGHNATEFLQRLAVISLYFFSNFLFVLLKTKTKIHLKYTALIIDLCALLILGFLPKELPPLVALTPVFFAMPFQWNAYPGSYGYASSTIFSTNNVRQASLAISGYIFDHDFAKLHRAMFFLGSLLFFHIGVGCSYLCILHSGLQSTWLCILALLPAVIFTWLTDHVTEERPQQTAVRHS